MGDFEWDDEEWSDWDPEFYEDYIMAVRTLQEMLESPEWQEMEQMGLTLIL